MLDASLWLLYMQPPPPPMIPCGDLAYVWDVSWGSLLQQRACAEFVTEHSQVFYAMQLQLHQWLWKLLCYAMNFFLMRPSVTLHGEISDTLDPLLDLWNEAFVSLFEPRFKQTLPASICSQSGFPHYPFPTVERISGRKIHAAMPSQAWPTWWHHDAQNARSVWLATVTVQREDMCLSSTRNQEVQQMEPKIQARVI